MPAKSASIKNLSGVFETFSRIECHNSSPLYEKLSLEISKDEEMLKLASNAVHSPVPNIFLAAVHFLLLKGRDNGLSVFYPDITDGSVMEGDPYPIFRSFCVSNHSEIIEIMKSRYVQTNEVQRCSLLMPALNLIFLEEKKPLAVVEVGTSAGLNLLFDQYRYDYGNGVIIGNRNSEVRLECELKGNNSPPLEGVLPQVNYKAGIDLNPVDVGDEDEVTWLKALIWPEHTRRRRIIEAAIAEAKKHDLRLVRGDASENLQNMISEVHEDTVLCVLSTFTLNQFQRKKREQFIGNLANASSLRPIYLVNIEYTDRFTLPYPEMYLTRFTDGKSRVERLALCHPHGNWLEWLKK